MATDPLVSPVVVDGVVSDEKVAELLALQTEYPELDYKSTIDVSTTEGVVELAKDVGAMPVRGGYILGGVDDNGHLTGSMNKADPHAFDEARLAPKLHKYLGKPLDLRTNFVDRDGHKVAVICVLPSPNGCTFMIADGQYDKGGKPVVTFRKGDVFWRDGTRSVRMDQDGFEELIRRRIQTEKEVWIAEQQEIRRRELTEFDEASRTRRLGEGPLGAISLDFDERELSLAVLDLVRRDDSVALRHLFRDARARAREFVEASDIDVGLDDLLNKVACVAATLVEYEQDRWLNETTSVLVDIYAAPLREGDVERYAYRGTTSPHEVAPRVWLSTIERVFAVGALAIRKEYWPAVRTLTLQLPRPLAEFGYDTNWLRHALTMASRAQHFERQEDGVKVSLLSLARNIVSRRECFRPDGVAAGSDEILTSLAQFDLLSNLVAIDDARSRRRRVFYTNFARFRQSRVQSIADRLVSDTSMRSALLTLDDEGLAEALQRIGEFAAEEGWRYDGFEGWEGTAVGDFIAQHLRTGTE